MAESTPFSTTNYVDCDHQIELEIETPPPSHSVAPDHDHDQDQDGGDNINANQNSSKPAEFTEDELTLMIRMFNLVGKRWSLIAGRIPGRSADEIEEYWTSTYN